MVIRCLVLDDAHLGIDIVLELEVVAVEVIGRDVEQNGNVGTEVVHVVELERTQFDDIVLVRFLSHLESKTLTDISGQSHVVSGTLEDVIDQRGGCRLAVAARDTDHLGVRISSCELNLADDMCVLGHQFLHHRSLFWDARAFDDLICTQDFLLGVMTFFPFDLMVVKQFLVLVLDRRSVRYENIETFFLCQHGSSCTALAGS